MACYFSVECIQCLLEMNHGTRFFARWRGVGIVSRATGGAVGTILIFVQNDREKKTKNKKQKRHC